jgi:hypothetical protein
VTSPLSKSSQGPAPRWTRDQIRAARLVPLVPLVQERALPLRPRDAHNYEILTHPGLLLKDSYWRWPERHLAGNAIDFCVQILGLSFHDAMRALLRT